MSRKFSQKQQEFDDFHEHFCENTMFRQFQRKLNFVKFRKNLHNFEELRISREKKIKKAFSFQT